MSENQKYPEIVICYPRIRGYILKVYELKQMLSTRFHATINTEEHAKRCLALVLDGKEIYVEATDEKVRINHRQCIQAVRELNITERQIDASPSETGQEADNDPEHRQWLNNVCSGE